MGDYNYSPRLSIDITEEQRKGLDKFLEFGMRKVIFHLLIDSFIESCEKYGHSIIIGALVERSIGIKELAKLKLEARNGNDKRSL